MKYVPCSLFLALVMAAALAPAAWADPAVEPRTGRSHEDLAYGPHERHRLDLWLPAKGAPPYPVLFFVHGGGFLGGDKSRVREDLRDLANEEGWALASTNYRFISEAPLPAAFHDAARALQYLRSHAARYGLNKERVALAGGSAGGGTVLWLATHDDLADPGSTDPIARESTRVSGVLGFGAQTSYDARQLRQWTGPAVLKHRAVGLLYGKHTVEQLLTPTPELASRMARCSPITHLSADDPPALLIYAHRRTGTTGEAVHSGILGDRFAEKAQEAGVSCTVWVPSGPGAGDAQEPIAPFLRSVLAP